MDEDDERLVRGAGEASEDLEVPVAEPPQDPVARRIDVS